MDIVQAHEEEDEEVIIVTEDLFVDGVADTHQGVVSATIVNFLAT